MSTASTKAALNRKYALVREARRKTRPYTTTGRRAHDFERTPRGLDAEGLPTLAPKHSNGHEGMVSLPTYDAPQSSRRRAFERTVPHCAECMQTAAPMMVCADCLHIGKQGRVCAQGMCEQAHRAKYHFHRSPFGRPADGSVAVPKLHVGGIPLGGKKGW